MAELQNFRTAFNGFHRDDVVRYIEQLNAKHAAEVNQLNSDLQYLQEKLSAMEAEADAAAYEAIQATAEPQPAPAAIACDDDTVRALEEKLAKAEETARIAEEQLLEQQLENERLQGLLDAALARQVEARTQQDAELDTYRRAERVERDARNRARYVSDKANDALTIASAKVDETAEQLSSLTDDAMQQLKQLMLAISGSKQILRDTAASLYAIRPEGNQE